MPRATYRARSSSEGAWAWEQAGAVSPGVLKSMNSPWERRGALGHLAGLLVAHDSALGDFGKRHLREKAGAGAL